MINTKSNQSFIFKCSGVLVTAILFLGLNTLLGCTDINSQSQESKNLIPNVSIRFNFDARLKARPSRIFLKKEEERYKKLEEIDSNQVQFYKSGVLLYNFCNIMPGKYWVGFSFKYLRKNESTVNPVEEFEFLNTWISTDTNLIEIKKCKRVFVDLFIKICLFQRPKSEKEDPTGYFSFINRSSPKSPEDEILLDENYFPLGLGVFMAVERSHDIAFDRNKLLFIFDVSNDYPFAQMKHQENQAWKWTDQYCGKK